MLGVQFSAGCTTCDEDLKKLASEVTILKQTKTLSLKLGLKVPRAVLKFRQETWRSSCRRPLPGLALTHAVSVIIQSTKQTPGHFWRLHYPSCLRVLAVDGQLGTGQRLQRGGIRAGPLCRERLSAKKL